MTPQEKQQEKSLLMQQLHKEWLHHPVTQSMLQILDTHQGYLTSKLASNLSDQELRFAAAQVRQTQAIRGFVASSEDFAQKQLQLEKQ